MIYHCPITTGGLATYAHYQAQAIVKAGCAVTMVTGADYEPDRAAYEIERLHPSRATTSSGPHWWRRAGTLRTLLGQQSRFAAYLDAHARSRVLMGAYFEYAAPLWAPRFRVLADRGTVFGAIVHDPVRNYVVGPQWWHRRSVAAGYSFLREAFVHSAIALDTAGAPAPRTTVIPHGAYDFGAPRRTGSEVRTSLRIPADAFVLLAFGHMRDGKNLDLAIETLALTPGVHLLVAGTPPAGANRPLSFYQSLAAAAGVAERCHWRVGYIDNAEIPELFAAADAALLTYSEQFRSASGVLNTAVAMRTPTLASSGDGDLKNAVEEYGLGVWVKPDDRAELSSGLRRLMNGMPAPRWQAYLDDHDWQANARLVVDRMFEP